MPWTEPEAWDIGDVLTEERLNEEIRDNLLVLKTMPHVEYTGTPLVKATTSTTFVDVDATNLNLDLTVEWASAIVEIGFVATGGWSASSGGVWLDIEVDGSRIGDAAAGLVATNASNSNGNMSFVAVVTGLSQGLHNFKAQFKTSAGAVGNLLIRQFWVRQVG